VLAYFAASDPALARRLDALGRLGLPTAVHLRGLGVSIGAAVPGNVAISAEPIDLDAALADASLVICNANQGVCCKALLAGVPLVLIPAQAEMTCLADRIVALGAGVAVPRGAPHADIAVLSERALGDPAVAVAAGRFADRYERFRPAAAVDQLATRCERMLRQARNG
jgi:UDP:flavonoid glycosyltransferase YjiC (YdhE family)